MEELFDEKKLRDPVATVEDKWKLLPAFLKVRGLVKQHIDSFDYFIEEEMKKIMLAGGRLTVDDDPTFYLEYKDIRIGKPSVTENYSTLELTPHDCRLRDLTYSAPIFVDIEYVRSRTKTIRKDLRIGHMPIMLKSSHCVLANQSYDALAQMKECPIDPGGYFIIRGVEKVILIQEQMSKNRMIIEYDQDHNIIASIISSTHERKSRCQIVTKNGKIYMKQSMLKSPVPIVILLKAMGIECDQEIIQLVGSDPIYSDAMSASLEEACSFEIFTEKQALVYIGTQLTLRSDQFQNKKKSKPRHEEARDILASSFLNHVPVINYNFRNKCIYIAVAIRRIILAMRDPSTVDDKDYYGNKRLELAGTLVSLLFENYFRQFNANLQKTIETLLQKGNKKDYDAVLHMKLDTITNGIQHAISSGNWNLARFKMERAGITQQLSRQSYIACLGMMTRVNSQFEKSRKVSGPRSLQPSQWGLLCPSDTPEGEACGLVKNLSLLTHITTDEDEIPIRRLAYNLGVESMDIVVGDAMNNSDNYVVFMNGTILGIVRFPHLFVKNFRRLRRARKVSEFISIYYHFHHRAIYIATDAGRVCRPLIIVENGIPKIKDKHIQELTDGLRGYEDFFKEGIIEYIDVNEENNCLIALKEGDIVPETTHMEIDQLTLLGVCAGLIPYPHHNQSPRNTYQCAMGKQAVGTIGYNQLNRFDTNLLVMVYPQRPLCETKTIRYIQFDKLPAGQNATVAVMSYSGYDIEDALILNKASLDRGFGRCIMFKRFSQIVYKYENGTQDLLGRPEPEGGKPNPKHEVLDTDGLGMPGCRIQSGQAWIHRRVPLNTVDILSGNPETLPTSAYKESEVNWKMTNIDHYYVDQVMITRNDDDQTIVKTKFRNTRRPELGDKFSSRHGQKGVTGLIVEQPDMPFNDLGMCPDIIMNPHGFPSRMTVGKMIELLAGKSGVLKGKFHEGTAFAGEKVSDISRDLIAKGFSYGGKDYLTSGVTGEALSAYIFFGPIYYQRLKHMVQDKMHARARGPRASLTRQPMEGRAKDGGLRLGEMERDCLIGYGASYLLLERLMISSDVFEVNLCNKCGLFGYEGWCQYCKSGNSVAKLKMPYAAKLLFQELEAMNVVPRMKTESPFAV